MDGMKDVPAGIRLILEEIRDIKLETQEIRLDSQKILREIADLRREATEDRRRADEDRRRADHRFEHIVRESGRRERTMMVLGRQILGTLQRIDRNTSRGNGRNGNGHGRR